MLQYFIVVLCALCVASTTIEDLEIAEEMLLSHKNVAALSELFGYRQMYQRPATENMWSAQNHTVQEDSSEEGSQCVEDLARVITSFPNEQWALRMLDADGKIPSGIMEGNALWLGHYFECLKTEAPAAMDNGTKVQSFRGRYCSLAWNISGRPIQTGMCVPDSCDGQDLMDLTDFNPLLRRVFGNKSSSISNKLRSMVHLNSATCKVTDREWSTASKALMYFLSIFGLFMVIGTGITVIEQFDSKGLPKGNKENVQPRIIRDEKIQVEDEIEGLPAQTEQINGDMNKSLLQEPGSKKRSSMVLEFFKCFCIITNGSKILDTSARGGDLRCVHGIRFLSMTWVILGHTYVFAPITFVTANIYEILNIIDTWAFQIIVQGTFSVDSFFLLSGFLLTHLVLKEMNAKDGKISWPMFYFHRYWRLTPVYMLVLAFDLVLAQHVSNGPLWPEDGNEANCRPNWWYNLLYINNFTDLTKTCMGWAWYLANDMQFYIISPLFLYPLWRWPKAGLVVVAVLLGGSWIATFAIGYHYNLMGGYSTLTKAGNILEYESRMNEYFQKLYIRPYTRIGPYMVGVLLGYLLFLTKGRTRFLPTGVLVAGWSSMTALTLGVVYGLYGEAPSLVANSFYNALSRSCFAFGLAWVIYVCLTGHGGFVNRILSYEGFIPLSRLTYCAYLVHPIIVMAYYQSLQVALHVTHMTMVTLFLGFLILSYAVAFMTSIAFESPFMALEKKILHRRPKPS